jgi:CubicO group peptidase (beta-lactamase class C family)
MRREALKMKNIFLLISLCTALLIPTLAIADHSPKKMMRNMKAYGKLGQTGKLGPFQVNVDRFGAIPKKSETSKRNKNYDKIFADKFNIATIILKGNEIVYERYATKRKINSNTPLLGMSMSKTAASTVIGSLLCEGKIKSLDDAAGNYSATLKASPYANIKIKNILQMNSGVSPIGRDDEKRFNQKSRGVTEKFSGKASVRDALKFYKKAARQQNSAMNYHSTDTLALSVLAEEISGKSLATVFHDKIYSKFGKSGYMHWTADKKGTTVSFSDLTMTARDWANFGKFLMEEKKSNSCLGTFFNEGVTNAVSTGKKNGSRYGYQRWVFDVNGKPAMVMQGHGGQFIVMDEVKNTVLLTISMNEKYKAGNLFNNINKFAERLN